MQYLNKKSANFCGVNEIRLLLGPWDHPCPLLSSRTLTLPFRAPKLYTQRFQLSNCHA